jgi:hypothetical protein
MHSYIFVPTRDLWPAASINAKFGSVGDIKASTWLDQNKSVYQMVWAPGQPTVIKDRFLDDGGWVDRPGIIVFNVYRPPTIVHGDPSKAGPWLDLVRKVFPDDASYIIMFLAHRVQKPEAKINHALLLGGRPGIGKDTILAPVRYAVGPWNFKEVSPQQAMGRFNSFVKSVVLRVSETRDLGEADRFKFHEHMKTYTASPPEVLCVDEKNMREYNVLNCCGVILTTNKKDSIYLPADDRRTYAAWSNLTKEDFPKEFWDATWQWYDDGGYGHVTRTSPASTSRCSMPRRRRHRQPYSGRSST